MYGGCHVFKAMSRAEVSAWPGGLHACRGTLLIIVVETLCGIEEVEQQRVGVEGGGSEGATITDSVTHKSQARASRSISWETQRRTDRKPSKKECLSQAYP